MRDWKSRVVFVIWLGSILAGAVFIWRRVLDVLGTASLSALAVAVFVCFALLAGPPRVVNEERAYRLTFVGIAKAFGVMLKSAVVGLWRQGYAALSWSERSWRRALRLDAWFPRFPRLPAPSRAERITFLRAWATLRETVASVRRTLIATGRWLAVFSACMVLGGVFLLGHLKQKFIAQMPHDMRRVTEYDPAVSTDVYDRHGEHICSFSTQYRVMMPIERIDPKIVAAIIAAEDDGFYEHHGIDPVAIVRAAYKNLLAGGRTKQGGSTITQQVVKQVLLANSERTVRRKVQEVILAVELERRLSKAQIVQVYANHAFLGHNAYGVNAATRTYFGKSASNVTLAEAALIAGLPQAPTRYSPFSHYSAARQRMRYVLGRMEATGAITAEEHRAALAEQIAVITAADPLNHSSAPYFCDLVRRELKAMYSNALIFERGLVAHTTLDMAMQRKAEASVRLGLLELERRLGFAGAEGHDKKVDKDCKGPGSDMADGALGRAVMIAVGSRPKVCLRGKIYPLHQEDIDRIRAWETTHPRLAVGDVLTVRVETVTEVDAKGQPVTKRYALTARRTGGADYMRALQASLTVVDPRTGELLALAPGFDFAENQFNNATQAMRQTGSAVKPFVYLAGLIRGMTVVDRMVDRQVCYGTASGTWCPSNYKDEFRGEVDLRTALAKSLNSISVQIGARVGVDAVIRTMQHLGITAKLDRALPITVGAEDVSPWEMTHAYAAIAAGGKVMPRHPGSNRVGVFLTKVEDHAGKTLFSMPSVPRREWPQAVPAADNYALIELMKGVVEEGTGKRVRELSRPAAGKTGTTNNNQDVWFMGFTSDLVAGVWVGRQSPHYRIGGEATGGAVAVPIWLAFMKSAHPNTPSTGFPPPPGVLLIPDGFGGLVPFQQGRIPENFLVDSRGLDENL